MNVVTRNVLDALLEAKGQPQGQGHDVRSYLEVTGFPLGSLEVGSSPGREVALDHLLSDLIAVR